MSDFVLTRGAGGYCLYLDGTRIAGPQPWGGGRAIVAAFATREAYAHERTCRNLRTPECQVGGFECSECGASFAHDVRFRFCPRCGARVVDGDE